MGSEQRVAHVTRMDWPTTARPFTAAAGYAPAMRDDLGETELGIRIVTTSVSLAEIQAMAIGRFGDLVKAVVDIERGMMAIDGEMHADEEAMLIEDGSRQTDLWGINLYPDQHGTSGFIEFDSMINVRPRRGNRSRSVEDPAVRTAITDLVGRLVAS